MTTEQEQFWRGEFGDAYHSRNTGRIENNVQFFRQVFASFTNPLLSLIEFGAGIGENLVAIQRIMPSTMLRAVEVNANAFNALLGNVRLNGASRMPMQEYGERGEMSVSQMSMTKGVLIHIPPEDIKRAYHALYTSSSCWILICEYYNPTPVEVEYRGHQGKLWKRDFAGEMLDTYKDLNLVDYGFRYHRDDYPQDDLTWFLLEKQS